jgi:hypothetical protein
VQAFTTLQLLGKFTLYELFLGVLLLCAGDLTLTLSVAGGSVVTFWHMTVFAAWGAVYYVAGVMLSTFVAWILLHETRRIQRERLAAVRTPSPPKPLLFRRFSMMRFFAQDSGTLIVRGDQWSGAMRRRLQHCT